MCGNNMSKHWKYLRNVMIYKLSRVAIKEGEGKISHIDLKFIKEHTCSYFSEEDIEVMISGINELIDSHNRNISGRGKNDTE